jgi:hypothetical protein
MTKWIFIGLVAIFVVSPRTAQSLVDGGAQAVVGTVRMVTNSVITAAKTN